VSFRATLGRGSQMLRLLRRPAPRSQEAKAKNPQPSGGCRTGFRALASQKSQKPKVGRFWFRHAADFFRRLCAKDVVPGSFGLAGGRVPCATVIETFVQPFDGILALICQSPSAQDETKSEGGGRCNEEDMWNSGTSCDRHDQVAATLRRARGSGGPGVRLYSGRCP